MTWAIGARQLVVQDALDTISIELSYSLWLTPYTNIGVSSLEGADNTTFLAPDYKWPWDFSEDKNLPVHSKIVSAPKSPHFNFAGSVSWVTLIF